MRATASLGLAAMLVGLLPGCATFREKPAWEQPPPPAREAPVVQEGTLTLSAATLPGTNIYESDALGRRVEETLLELPMVVSTARRTGRAELGVISGDRSLGVGRLVTHLPGPNDGTVALAETRLPGAVAHLVLHSSHMGLVFSSTVAAAVCRFLEAGRFDP